MASVSNSAPSAGEKESNDTINVSLSSRKFSKETIALKDIILEAFPNGFDHNNIMETVVRSIQYLKRKQRKLTGQQKKKLVVDALLLVLDETNSGSLEVFEPLVKNMIPTVVDNLIDVEKGKIKLNKRKKSCLSLLCGCGVCC